jgi:SOS response regulatory protein OraA/RecX
MFPRIVITLKYILSIDKIFKLAIMLICMAITEKGQNQQLADYIKKNLVKGYTADALRYSLLKQGYSRTSVEKAIEIANRQLAESAPKMEEKPVVKWEVIDDNDMKQKVAEQDGESRGFFSRLWHNMFG